MKAILAIAVISCFFVVASSQSLACIGRASDLATCLSMVGSATDTEAFCRDCGNSLVAYYRDCAGGAGVAQIQQICPNATGGGATIHTATALITALVLTGVAVLFY